MLDTWMTGIRVKVLVWDDWRSLCLDIVLIESFNAMELEIFINISNGSVYETDSDESILKEKRFKPNPVPQQEKIEIKGPILG